MFLPDFVKLVAIGWIGSFSSLVTGVETAQERFRFKKLSGEKKTLLQHL